MTEKKLDRLSALVQNFRITANVLATQKRQFADGEHALDHPNLFIIQEINGVDLPEELAVYDGSSPCLIFFPDGGENDLGARLKELDGIYVSASIKAGDGPNPISRSLPDLVSINLDQESPLRPLTDMLVEEVFSPRCGGKAVIDRLCEIVVIRMLRHLIESSDAQVGLLAGLAHPKLSHSLVAMHNAPGQRWSLEDLADLSAMSRSHFATVFKETLGITPGEYLTQWRLAIAQTELTKGTPLKTVVGTVGFSSSAALSRAFRRRYGISPRDMLLT